MGIYIYGAGINGDHALRVIAEEYQGIPSVIGVMDRAKTGAIRGHEILPPDRVADLESTILIAIGALDVAVDVWRTLKKRGHKSIWWYNYHLHSPGRDFLEEQCDDCAYWAEDMLPHVEMHIMDSCNLNCRGCTHFSPIFPNERPDLDSRLRDVQILSEKISHIVDFHILGGEPFLNPEIGEYVKGIRAILPHTNLYIVTNGTLFHKVSDETLRCIEENRCRVSITQYPPTTAHLAEIEDRLKKFDIAYDIRSHVEEGNFILPLTLSSESKYPWTCISVDCVNIWNGKIARCPTLMYIPEFNKHFHTDLPDEGIMDLNDCPSGKRLQEILRREVPLCKYCVRNEIQWASCGKNARLEDFAAPD